MVTTIEERLTQLERKNHRLTSAMLSMGVTAALVVAIGMARTEAVPDVMKAHGFEILDDNGKVRVTPRVNESGPTLNLWDRSGEPCAGLAIDNDSPRILLWDDDGKQRAVLGLTKNEPLLQFSDKTKTCAPGEVDPILCTRELVVSVKGWSVFWA